MAQVIRARSGSPTVIEERADGSIVLEADAAEDAVETARERFGPDAEIIEITRLVRGGVKGFFAREYFNVTAGPPRSTQVPTTPVGAPPAGVRPEVDALVRQIGRVGGTPPPPPAPSSARSGPAPASPAPAPARPDRDRPADGIGHVLGRVETEEEAFGSMLRRELHARGLTPSATSSSTPAAAETIDLTDRGVASADEPVRVGPAAVRPLRPTASPASVPPPPVPPQERFRLDAPTASPSPAPGTAAVSPLPVRAGAATDAARATLRDSMVVESQAMVRPPRTAAPRPAATPAAEPTAAPAAEPLPVAVVEAVAAEPVAAAGPVAESSAAPPAEPVAAEPVATEPVAAEPVDSPVEVPSESMPVEPETNESAALAEAPAAPATALMSTAAPQTAVVAQAVELAAPETPPGLGSVRWSVDRLAHLGLPFALVQRTVGLDPSDDQRWLLTLAEGLADFVRPEPAGSAVFAGPRADRIGAAMDLPVVEAPELPPYGGSVALKTTDDGAGRAWLSRVRGDRVLHVVVGGRGWELLLAKDPDAVVISSADSVLTGLQVAVEHAVPISYVSDADGLRRADALDLAIAVRSLVGRW